MYTGMTRVLFGGCRISGMRSTGVGLVPGLVKGSKEGRLAALERFEGRWARKGEQPPCRRPATLPSVTVDEQQNRFVHIFCNQIMREPSISSRNSICQ